MLSLLSPSLQSDCLGGVESANCRTLSVPLYLHCSHKLILNSLKFIEPCGHLTARLTVGAQPGPAPAAAARAAAAPARRPARCPALPHPCAGAEPSHCCLLHCCAAWSWLQRAGQCGRWRAGGAGAERVSPGSSHPAAAPAIRACDRSRNQGCSLSCSSLYSENEAMKSMRGVATHEARLLAPSTSKDSGCSRSGSYSATGGAPGAGAMFL